MPRAPILFPTVVAGLLLMAAPVLGQTPPSQAAGMRTLDWPGKPAPRPAPAAPAAPAPAAIRLIDAPVSWPPGPSSYGLTPASAWLRPSASQPVPPAPPAPLAQHVPQPEPQPAPRPAPPPVRTAAVEPEAPVLPPRPVATEPTPEVVADPMAPRRDAPIFRMQAATPPAPPADAPRAAAAAPADPAAQGARYYSVHRAAGRQPDPTPLPQPFFLDSAPVDLAEPPAQPTIIRDSDGRARSPLVDEPELP